MNKKDLGNYAEKLATEYLLNKDYEILDRNYYIRGGEIDIVAKIDDELVFVEVKSLSNENFLTLEETISDNKAESLIRACKHWIKSKNFDNIDWRIDFIGMILDNGKIKKLKHIKNAIY